MDERIASLREAYAALNRNDIPAMVEAFDPAIEWIEMDIPGGGTHRGIAAVRAHFAQSRERWAEGTCEPERFLVAGDKIVAIVHVHVRLKGETEWREGQLADVYTFRDGKAVQGRVFPDRQKALEWAGVKAADARSTGTLLLLVAVLFAALAASPPTNSAGNRIRGEWRGTSQCMNLKLAPGCKDETTRYVFTGPTGGANTYHVAADKLVGKTYQPMGEFDLNYSAADSTWAFALDVSSCKECRWWFRVRGSQLIGGLTSAAHDTLRKVTATRHSP